MWTASLSAHSSARPPLWAAGAIVLIPLWDSSHRWLTIKPLFHLQCVSSCFSRYSWNSRGCCLKVSWTCLRSGAICLKVSVGILYHKSVCEQGSILHWCKAKSPNNTRPGLSVWDRDWSKLVEGGRETSAVTATAAIQMKMDNSFAQMRLCLVSFQITMNSSVSSAHTAVSVRRIDGRRWKCMKKKKRRRRRIADKPQSD